MNRPKLSRKLITALSVSVLTLPIGAQESEQRVERLEVTGSHIRRIDVEGPSPIQVLSREDLDNTGYNSVSDVLRDLTVSSAGSRREASGSNAAGTSSVSLRGLGASRTLVLLDGRRLPLDPVIASVDLNLIPMAAVERIEILKDGASATYGSDALGGVVNIITRKNYNGTEISARTSITNGGGGERTNVSLINGTATNRASVITVLNYRNNKRLFSRDRDWSSEGSSIFAEPANVQMGDTDGYGAIQLNDNCSDINPENDLCNYRFSDFSDEIPGMEQISIMSQFTYDINPDLTYYARLMATRSHMEWQYAPAASFYELISGENIDAGRFAALRTYLTNNGVTDDSDSGTADRLLVRDRLTDLGPRTSDIRGDAYNIHTGLRGYFFDTWEWDASYSYSHTIRTDISKSGYLLASRLADVIDADPDAGYNPFAPPGSRDNSGALQSGGVLYQPWDQQESTSHYVQAVASGEAFSFAGRPVAMAVGTSYLYDAYNQESDVFSINGDVLGSAGSTGRANRNAVAAFTEFGFNPVEPVEVQIAGRFDHYNDFGSTINPSIRTRWQATRQLMVRASAGTGFKAPTLQQLYGAQSVGNPTFVDAVACDEAKTNPALNEAFYCRPQQYEVRSGGNPDLQEEKSISYNVGMLYQATRNTSFGFDFFAFSIEDSVGVNLDKLMEAELKLGAGALAARGIDVERDSNNRLIRMEALDSNLASSKLYGIDLTMSHTEDTNIGAFALQVDHSQLFRSTIEYFPGLGEESSFLNPSVPRWRNNISLGYQPSFHMASSLFVVAKTIAPNYMGFQEAGRLKRYTEFDLQYNLALPWQGTFTLGVYNIFNTKPPFDTTSVSSKVNGDLYNNIGQTLYAQYTQSF